MNGPPADRHCVPRGFHCQYTLYQISIIVKCMYNSEINYLLTFLLTKSGLIKFRVAHFQKSSANYPLVPCSLTRCHLATLVDPPFRESKEAHPQKYVRVMCSRIFAIGSIETIETILVKYHHYNNNNFGYISCSKYNGHN